MRLAVLTVTEWLIYSTNLVLAYAGCIEVRVSSLLCEFLCRRPVQLTTNTRHSCSSRSVSIRVTLPTCLMCPGPRYSCVALCVILSIFCRTAVVKLLFLLAVLYRWFFAWLSAWLIKGLFAHCGMCEKFNKWCKTIMTRGILLKLLKSFSILKAIIFF